jgi:hypothetical protein
MCKLVCFGFMCARDHGVFVLYEFAQFWYV